MANITIGANTLIERQLYRVDGTTPLLLSELVTVQAQVKQYGKVFATYNLKPGDADDEIRQGASTSKIEIEITKALSAQFKEGAVDIKLILEETDADFTVDGEFRSSSTEFEAFTAIL